MFYIRIVLRSHLLCFSPKGYLLPLVNPIPSALGLLVMAAITGYEPKLNDKTQTIVPIQGSDTSESHDDQIAGFTYQDKTDMKRMGKKQELRRSFRILSSIAFTTCNMGTWELLLTANTQGLIAGGSAGLFWSLVWVYIGQAFVILSLAEMASIAPTAGGQYHWVSEFAPREYQKIMSYTSGWLSTLAWQSFVAVDSFLMGEVILGIIAINDQSFVPQRWHATLLIIATVLALAGFNFLAGKWLADAENYFFAFHILAFLPVIVTLLAMTPEKQTAKAVFTQFTDNGAGWSSMSLTVMVGQVSCIFVVLGVSFTLQFPNPKVLTEYVGSDSAAHICMAALSRSANVELTVMAAEEISDAGHVVPRSMVWSFFLNIPLTFGLLISYLFCIDDISEALSSPSGYPFIYVFQNATGSVAGATGLTVIILLLLVFITTSAYASTSRQLFAFARDNGMPFSNWLARVLTCV